MAAVEELERLTKLLKEPLAEEVAAARQEGEAAAAARGGSLRSSESQICLV